MKNIFLILFAFVLIGISASLWLFFHYRPERILRRMSGYYESLDSFEGMNTIVAGSPPRETVNKRQFAFLRPNKFVILSGANGVWGTNGPQFICDGTNIYDFQPYYYNSYTRIPAPPRFEEAITNQVGGQMLRIIANTNAYEYAMSGFGRGLAALRYAGHEKIEGVDCDHLHFQEPRAETMELWVARGASPYVVKYTASFRNPLSTNQMMVYTETISDWRANTAIPGNQFVFAPPAGAVEHGSDNDRVAITTNPGGRETVEFIPPGGKTKSEELADFLKENRERFRMVALTSILAKYKDLTARDLAFVDVQPSPFYTSDKTLIATFAVSKTVKTTETGRSDQTTEQTISVTVSAAGEVVSVSKGTSISFRSIGN